MKMICLTAVNAIMTACCVSLAAAQGPLPEAAAVAEIEALGGHVYRNADKQVDMVSLRGKQFGDEHLKMLQSFPALRDLNLESSRVTDAGLEELLKLPRLEEVSLRRTRVTRTAALAFKDKHPGVWHVDAPPAAKPAVLGLVAAIAIPLAGVGVWLFRAAQRKRDILAPQLYARSLLYGVLLVGVAILLLIAGLLQALGIDFKLNELFGG